MHLSFRFQPCFLLDERGSPTQKFATDVVDASTCFLSWISFAFWHVTLLCCFPRDVRYLLSFKLTKKHLWHISHCHLGQLSLSLHCARIIPIPSRKKESSGFKKWSILTRGCHIKLVGTREVKWNKFYKIRYRRIDLSRGPWEHISWYSKGPDCIHQHLKLGVSVSGFSSVSPLGRGHPLLANIMWLLWHVLERKIFSDLTKNMW